MEERKIILGADHAGFALKEHLKTFLKKEGWQVTDVGTNTDAESCDYPEIAFSVAEKVAGEEFPFGVLVCGSGQGMAISANKVAGVRAVSCQDTISAVLSRSHNDACILCLGGRLTTPLVAEEILKVFLQTPFTGGRHQRRIAQISDYEKEKEGQ